MSKRLRTVMMSITMVAVMLLCVFTDTFYVQAANISSGNRHLVISYTRTNKDYKTSSYNWNFWIWEDGSEGKAYEGTVSDGKLVVDVTLSSTCEKVGFILRKSTSSNEWADKDGEDRYLDIPSGQNIIKINVTQGKAEELDAPYNTGYELTSTNGAVTFYYRDDTRYYNNTLSALTGKVSIEIDGTIYPMSYDSANRRFYYNAAGLTETKHYYRYIVNGTSSIDKYNKNSATYNGNKCSYFNYEKPYIKAELSDSNISYNENTVIKIISNTMTVSDIKSIYADLSSIGGDSKFAIDSELMEGTIGVKDTVTAGEKKIPITVTLNSGTVYNLSADLTVEERKSASVSDFDWDEAVIYFMLTDRFYDGNTTNNKALGVSVYNPDNAGLYHGGDFAGVTKKLDYLQDLGINTIWITPIVDNVPSTSVSGNKQIPIYASYHGYWARDFEKLNANLGTEAEFRTLINEAHKRGIKIMVDVVLNHSGYGTETSSLFSGMLRTSTTTVAGSEIYASLSGLPDFLTEYPLVREKLIAWQTAWMTEYDIDYFRVDTVKHVDNTTWKAFKNSVTESNSAFKMIGEYWGASYSNQCQNLSTGSLDSLLDFGFKEYAKQFVNSKLSGVESTLEKRNAAINNTATLGSFLSSHDEDGFYYTLKKTYSASNAEALMKVVASMQITAKGQPIIYYGEEIGLSGANHYPSYENRYDFDWSMVNTSNTIYNHYKKMLNIRKTYSKIFAKGDRTSVAVSDSNGYMVFSRTYENSSLVVGLNIKNTDRKVTVKVPWSAGTAVRDVYNNKNYTVSESKTITVTIPSAANGGTIVLAPVDGKRVVVKFNGNGGTSSLSAKQVLYGGSANTLYGELPTAKKNGYTFKGWYTAASGGIRVTNISSLRTTNDHTLYAQWSAIPYTLKFDAKGGTVSTASKTIYYYKAYGTLPTPTRKGYTFKGWYTQSGTKVSASTVHKQVSGRTLYAHWTANKYTITLNANGGKITGTNSASSTKTVTFGNTYGTLKSAKRSGYVFKGWYTSKNYTNRITSGAAVTYAGNRTLYAKWTKVTAPGKVTVSSLNSNTQKKMTLAYAKVSDAEGYEIKYSTKSNFSSNSKTIRTTKTTYSIGSLTRGKKYYVKIRAYKKDSTGERIYGAWSTVKSVTVQ